MDLLAMRRYLSPSTTSTFSSAAVSPNDNSNEIRSIHNDKSILLVEHQQKIFVHRMNCTRQFTENCQKGMMITEDDYNQNCLPNHDYDNCLANNQTNTVSQILVAPTPLSDVINASIADTNDDFNSFYFYEVDSADDSCGDGGVHDGLKTLSTKLIAFSTFLHFIYHFLRTFFA